MLKAIDLCSGYGGASEAFLQAGDDVQRYEIDRSVAMVTKGTTSADIRNRTGSWLQDSEDIDLVWISIPCREFSTAYSAPKSVARRRGDDYSPDLSMLKRGLELIDIIKPRYHVIECVMGAREDFRPIVGEPLQILGAYCLWGNFPAIALTKRAIKAFPKKNRLAGGNDRHSVQKRSVIPISISWGLREAILCQRTLEDFV